MPNFVNPATFSVELADLIRRSITSKTSRKLVIIIGAGVGPSITILHRNVLSRELRQKTGFNISVDEACWAYFENARFRSGNVIPSPDYYAVYRILKSSASNKVITTNYDLWLESIFRRVLPGKEILKNPVNGIGEYTCEDLVCRSSNMNCGQQIILWKIHGCLNYVIFNKCYHVFRLPNFLVGYPQSPKRSRIVPDFRHCFIGPNTGYKELGAIGQNCNHRDKTGSPLHYIDFNFSNRELFKTTWEAAGSFLKRCFKTIGLVVLGFTGRYNDKKKEDPWNEAIVKPILSLARTGVPVMMAIGPDQKQKFLWQQLFDMPGNILLTQGDLSRILLDACEDAGIMTAIDFEKEYKKDWEEKFLDEKEIPNLKFQ